MATQLDLLYLANTANSPNSSLTTNFNVTPYYDDYETNKDYYRILFKPGYAVQARELTQIQSMIQSQINRFGKHVFKEGSIVLPGSFNIKANLRDQKMNPIDYVKIQNTDALGNNIDVNAFLGQIVNGATSNVSALIVDVLDTDGTSTNTKTFYVTYLNASPADPTVRVFQPGETLNNANTGPCLVLNTDPVANTGYASWFQISSGVVFAKDHFVSFPTQSVVLNRYDANPTCKVGFYVTEDIINSSQDTSLLDPALEASNYSAPGADRLKLTPELAVVPYDDVTSLPDFVTLFTIKEGVVQITNESTQYNILGDTLAKRTYDETGDYVVRGLNTQIQEHLDNGVNKGRYTLANGGNSQLLIVSVDPGHAYVKGYPVDNNDSFPLEIPKPLNYQTVPSQISSTGMGQYITVNQFVGSWQADQGTRINLYDVPQQRISNFGSAAGIKWSTGTQTGNVIGTAAVTAIQYNSGTPGYDAKYDIYLTDITMVGANSFANVRSVYYDNSVVADSGADILGASNTSTNTVLQGLTTAPLLYKVGSNYTKTVTDSTGNPATIYLTERTAGTGTTLSVSANGILNFSAPLGTYETLPYGTTAAVSATDVSQDLILTLGTSVNIGPLWSTSAVATSGAGTTTLNGTATKFTRFNIGDKIEIGGLAANTFYVASIANDTTLTLTTALPAGITLGVAGNNIYRAYKTGEVVYLTGTSANSGAQRTVSATPSSLSINLATTFATTIPVTLNYKVSLSLSAAQKAAKTLNSHAFVKINCSSAGTTGPFCLGFSDVYQIRNIIKKTGSAPSGLTDGTNVTKYFVLNNGQKDTLYDLAYITPSSYVTLGATDYLLIELDYFSPTYSGGSYFTIDSYPVNDSVVSDSYIRTENIPIYTSPTSQLKYDLRNQIDFRPVKSITANNQTNPAYCVVNPSNTSTTFYNSAAMKFPIPSSELIYSYQYYLGRQDIVAINKNGDIAVTEGVPEINPIVPQPIDTQMLIAILNIPPYPSLSPAYGNILGRKDIACSAKKVTNRGYTMRDIGVLDNRIKNLEYYASLTLLEKDALAMKVLDVNGLDRFKNGIFIDTFKDTSLTSKGIDPDYRIVTDPVELSIRPLFSSDSFKYNFLSGSNIVVNSNKVTFAYDETIHFSQTRVTDARNLERGTYYYQGNVTMFPNQDVWVDTSYAEDETVTLQANGATLSVDVSTSADIAAKLVKTYTNTTWGDWKTKITGYNLYRGQGASRAFVGTYSDEATARAVAASWTTAQGGGPATLETVYDNTRLGINWFANESTDTAVGAYKLVSSSMIPYIRPQDIEVRVSGMKPYSKLHVFFDGVNVDQYVSPLTYEQFSTLIAGGVLPIDANLPVLGNPLIVDTSGNAYFTFKISAAGPKFRTGERRLIVMDSSQVNPQNPATAPDSSTYASAYFFADGTKQTLQRTVFSTEGFRVTGENTMGEYTSYADDVLPNTWRPPPPPAYSCFNPEAKVLMADRTWKPIADVKIGDEVVGANLSINKVVRTLQTTVNGRKMMKITDNAYATDDHIFLSDKGWKTWNPQHVIDIDAVNAPLLEGENREKSIDPLDKLKIVDIVDNTLTEKYVDVNQLGHEIDDTFDPEYVVYDLTLDGDETYIVEGYVVHNCCYAYTVKVRAPTDEEGIFVTSYDVFIERKSPTRGLWFEIRELDSAGQVSSTQVPGSRVDLSVDEVLVSPDGKTNPTNVKFKNPIFLFNNKSYAFVIHSVSPSNMTVDPDTMVWVSRLGEVDVNTGAVVTDRQRLGDLFNTQNNQQWDLVPDVDLVINVYRAQFTKGTTTFEIGNEPVEKFLLSNVSTSLSGRVGDDFISGDTLTVSSANGTISVGDILIGNTSLSSANGRVIAIPSTGKYAMSNTGYKVGERISAFYASNLSYKGITGIVTSTANASATLTYYTESAANVYAEMTYSSGGFLKGQTIRSVKNDGFGYRTDITDILDFPYSVVSFEPNALDFIKTDIFYEMNTYANNSVVPSGYVSIHPSETYYFSEEKQLSSRTNEINNLSGSPSNKVRVTFNSDSEYVSPLLDLDTTTTIYIDNLINSNTSSEGVTTIYANTAGLATTGGASLNKYISQVVTLADGQDAEDLNVFLTAYRPPGTDVKVYCKLLNGSDPQSINQASWLEMSNDGDGPVTYSSLSNRDNFLSYTYVLPTSMKTGTATGSVGAVQYISNGVTYTGYKYFKLKIVLVTAPDALGVTNTAVVPRVADLRAIALQM
ncbi:DUF4815 domain-containing protein [bacterium]|nr:DUF4815 domain-containing protein [bacterium]